MKKNQKTMKKKLLILSALFFTATLTAQVGVNTESPQGVFHIDAARDTSGDTNVADDVIVNSSGNLGVGTNDPQTKVDIRSSTQGGGFRLQDGTQGNSMVLTSDANGNGRWSAPGFSEFAQLPGYTSPVINFTDTMFYDTGYSFTLGSRGTYFISLAMRIDVSTPVASTLYEKLGRSALIFRSTNNPDDYTNNGIRFLGSYEQPLMIVDLEVENTARKGTSLFGTMNQIITTERDNQRVYVLFWSSPGPSFARENGVFKVRAGEGGLQISGGACVRIN
ncbi:hypothetical protein [Dysgonomonas sp. 520]|uniref:hypothetical protein n=1 Tax=Dysgonomonas sp. 520 TaxID=2302931 RepID=UPI0013D02D6F|nr:hypothetical protein [Dysgonomonas sp. 520]NDW08390.1 hypothetical protein [Dysgonomonas sp. 520]